MSINLFLLLDPCESGTNGKEKMDSIRMHKKNDKRIPILPTLMGTRENTSNKKRHAT